MPGIYQRAVELRNCFLLAPATGDWTTSQLAIARASTVVIGHSHVRVRDRSALREDCSEYYRLDRVEFTARATAMVLHEMQGQLVPRSFTPGYVILSFIVSYVGAWTTLELLHRRTAGRGLYNWYVRLAFDVSR